jgi:hypothetical protein
VPAQRSTATGKFERALRPWTPRRWDEGFVDARGYFRVYRPDYPRAWGNGGAKRYVIVWWLKTGKVIPPGMVLHHKDEDTLNDTFDNLEMLTNGEHTRLHQTKPRPFLHCQNPACGISFLLPKGKSAGRRRFCSLTCRGNARSKLSPQQVQLILQEVKRGTSRLAVARRFGVNWYVVNRIVQARS